MKAFGDFEHVDVSTEDAFAEAYDNLSRIPVADVSMAAHLHECKRCGVLCPDEYENCDPCDNEPRMSDEDRYDAEIDRRAVEGMTRAAE